MVFGNRKPKKIGRSYKSGNMENTKHKTCNRKIVQPSENRSGNNVSNESIDRLSEYDTEESKSRASCMAKHRYMKKLKETILDKKLSVKEQGQALKIVLTHPDLNDVVKEAELSIKSSFDDVAIHSGSQLKRIMNFARSKKYERKSER